jgi:hypothetical protein
MAMIELVDFNELYEVKEVEAAVVVVAELTRLNSC